MLEQLFGYVSSPERSAATLKHWGAATRFSELTPGLSRDQVLWTLRALPYMRDRLTLARTFCDVGRVDGNEFLERVLERAT